MFDWLYTFFGWIIKGCNYVTNNYVLAIVLFSIVIKLLLFPLGIKQQKNSIRQAKLRPKEMAIRKKYAGRNDKATQQKMQQEIMDLYTQEKYNPMSGCLPLLIQLPLLWIVFNIIREPEKYLDTAPNFKLFGADFQYVIWSESGIEFSWWLIIPVLTFVVYFFGAKLTRKFTYNPQTAMGGDASKSMAIMDLVMPLFSVFITFKAAALIGIYWIFNSLLGTLQQFILSKMYPLPEFTEEDFKRAELEMKGKSPKTKSSSNPNKKKKSGYSLHHIDDDEDDGPQSKAPSNKNKSGMASMIDRPELKEDRKPEEKSGEKPEEGEGGQN